MVIHEDSERPVEVSVIKEPLFEQKSHIYMNNNVQKIPSNNENTELSANIGLKVKKSKKTRKKKGDSSSCSTDIEEFNNSAGEISAEDLTELKTVYYKCKKVLKKIEDKYGHLLDLDDEDPSNKRRKQANSDYQEEDSQCQCTLNKKIVFDEEGKEVTIDTLPDNHICPQKLMLERNYNTCIENNSIQIEYGNEIELSDNIQELTNILQNPEIEATYRNQVINKVRLLKQEYSNDIKFNKHSLVEKLKSDPDELLNFKGANLSSLSGYL